MSRIGRLPIPVPAGVDVQIADHLVTVKGPKGTLSRELHPDMLIKLEDGKVIVDRPTEAKDHKSLHGLTRTLVANMVEGVTKGFSKKLHVVGVGYRALVEGEDLTLQVGYSNPVQVKPFDGISFEAGRVVDNRELPAGVDSREQVYFITLSGINKEDVGQQAAEIRRVRPPEPYKGKGIRYAGEKVRRKAGKAGKAAGT